MKKQGQFFLKKILKTVLFVNYLRKLFLRGKKLKNFLKKLCLFLEDFAKILRYRPKLRFYLPLKEPNSIPPALSQPSWPSP